MDECKPLPTGMVNPHSSLTYTRTWPVFMESLAGCPPGGTGGISTTEVVEDAAAPVRQGLTLVHCSAQPKRFWSNPPVSPCITDWEKSCTQRILQTVLTLSRKVDEFKPLPCAPRGARGRSTGREAGRPTPPQRHGPAGRLLPSASWPWSVPWCRGAS